MKFINIGFGNMVAVDRVITLASPDSAPIKRLIQDAKDEGRTIDVTCGRRTRAVIITDSDHVILSAIQSETIANRLDSDSDEDRTTNAATFPFLDKLFGQGRLPADPSQSAPRPEQGQAPAKDGKQKKKNL